MIGIVLLIVGGSMLAYGIYETINGSEARKAAVDTVGGDDRLLLQGSPGNDPLNGWRVNDAPQGSAGQDVLTEKDDDDLFVAGKTLLRDLTLTDLQGLPTAGKNGGAVTQFDNTGIERVGDDGTDPMDKGVRDTSPEMNDGQTAPGRAGADGLLLPDRNGSECVAITEFKIASDTLLYVYDGDEPEPELAMIDNQDGSQTLFVNGEQVAIVTADGPIGTEDVVLFERGAIPNLGL